VPRALAPEPPNTPGRSCLVSDHLLTAEQVATLLGTTPRHVRRLVFERRIAYRKLGRYVRFHPADVAEYVERCSVPVGSLGRRR
jgi:excisionase family DNA binding protein